MIFSILSTVISLGIMAICLYIAIMLNVKYQAEKQVKTSAADLARQALYKAVPITGACIMAIKALHLPVSYLLALAVFACMFLYEFISLKLSVTP